MTRCTLDTITAKANPPTPEAIKLERDQQLDAFMELRRILGEDHAAVNVASKIKIAQQSDLGKLD